MLENPSTAFGDDLDEKPVQAEVPRDLGVEGRGQHVTLTHRDDPTGGGAGLHPRQHLGTRPDLLDPRRTDEHLSLIHISEPTRLGMISYAVFCLKKKKKKKKTNKTRKTKKRKKKKKKKKKTKK